MTTAQDLFDLTGKTAVVTGGCGVLGSAISAFLAENGVNVVLLDRAREQLNQCAEQIGGRTLAIYADVLDRETLITAAEQVEAHFGAPDILINCAGGNNNRATTSADLSFFDLPADALQWVFNLNFLGTVLPTQIFVPPMMASGAGVVLNVSSMSAFRPLTRVPAYSAAKAAVSNFTQWLAVHMAEEYGPSVRINAIAPGFFSTQQNHFLLYDENEELTPRGQKILDHTPMRRFGVPADLLGTVLWLLSPASAFVTGTVIPIDGGFNAYAGV